MRRLAALLIILAPLSSAAAQELRFARPRPVDMEHLRLEVTPDLQGRRIEARAHWTITALQPITELRLDAVGLEVERLVVTRNGRPGEVPFVNTGEELIIELPPCDRGQQFELVIDYIAREARRGLYFRGPSTEDPDVPWQLWTQGEADETRHWIPCLDHPNERQTTELIVTVPAGLEVLSNGELISKEAAEGAVRWHWKQGEDHVVYLVTLVVGSFDVLREEWRGKPVTYYVPQGWKSAARHSFENTKPMLDLYSELTGRAYPWDKYAQVVVEQFTFGGMENTSATTLHSSTLHDARAHLDFSSDGLVAHELAHQWFGDLLTCKDWSHIWLNEGFATYFEALWTEHAKGRDEFLYNMWGKSFPAMGAAKKGPVVDRGYRDPMDNFDGRAYPKGAWVLHMLRRQLGDEAFWRGIRLYVERHAHDTVETNDLKQALEDASGASLGRLFHDALMREGGPTYKVKARWLGDEKLLRVDIQQSQKGAPFAYPIAVEVGFADGSPSQRRRITMTESTHRLFWPLERRPARFSFDPGDEVLEAHELDLPQDWWLAQLRDDPCPIGRIEAAKELAKRRRDPLREAVASALATDPFWGVREQAARALGEAGGGIAKAALIAALAQESPEVRRAAAEALRRFGADDEVAAAARARLEAGEPSVRVEAELLDLIWTAGGEALGRPFAEAALGQESHRDQLRGRALRLLQGADDPGDVDIFLRLSQPGYSFDARRSAFQGLGRLGAMASLGAEDRGRVLARLEAALQGGSARVQREALGALRQIGKAAAGAREVLEVIAAHDADEDVRKAAGEALAALRKGEPRQPEVERLKARLAELEAQARADRERLEKVEAQLEGKSKG